MSAPATRAVVDLPVWPHDLYSDEVLRDPWATFAALRHAGAAVRLAHHDNAIALPRYAEVRAALADPDTFCSGSGASLNPLINQLAAGSSVLHSDGERHSQLRVALTNPLTPRALRSMTETVQSAANALVDNLVQRESFDAVTDLAVALPLSIVPDLVGWPNEERENLRSWAAAAFETMGPANARVEAALPRFIAMNEFASKAVASGKILPGSIIDEMLSAARRGEVPIEQCQLSLVDLIIPSVDTTIGAISGAVRLFAEHPEQWDLVRADPALIPSAFNEVVRMESPVTQFAREVTKDTEFAGALLPAGTRVLVMFASANRDERKWDRPDEFDVRRNPTDMLGFGFGTHGCAGQGLARLEGHAVLRALATRVARFEAGTPQFALNNTIQSLASLPVTVQLAAVAQ